MAALEGFFEHLESVLVRSGYHDPDNPGQTMTRLRRLFLRTAMDEKEVQMLRGLLKELDPARQGQAGSPGAEPPGEAPPAGE
jgi:tRNA (cytidine32/uridine32-2'-O)-methyltransferase